jgi:hypothetical protein
MLLITGQKLRFSSEQKEVDRIEKLSSINGLLLTAVRSHLRTSSGSFYQKKNQGSLWVLQELSLALTTALSPSGDCGSRDVIQKLHLC